MDINNYTGAIYTASVLIIIGVFKDNIIAVIKNTLRDIRIYRDRSFDLDGDPKTDDVCLGTNGATGEDTLLLIHEYILFDHPKNRGVNYSKVNTKTGTKKYKHASFAQWDAIDKSKIEEKMTNKEQGFLKDKGLIGE